MEETILLVGDHEAVRSALRKRLEMAFPRYRVMETAGTEEAIALVLSRSPRIVILDIGPPAAERLGVARRIKTKQPSVQIVDGPSMSGRATVQTLWRPGPRLMY